MSINGDLLVFNQLYGHWITLAVVLLCFGVLVMLMQRLITVLEQLRDFWREHLAFMEGRNSTKQP